MDHRSPRSSSVESEGGAPVAFTPEQIDAGIRAVEALEVMRKVWRPEEKREAFLEAAALATVAAPVPPPAKLRATTVSCPNCTIVAELVSPLPGEHIVDAVARKLDGNAAEFGGAPAGGANFIAEDRTLFREAVGHPSSQAVGDASERVQRTLRARVGGRMTEEELARRIEGIRVVAGDDETAHAAEDALREEVLHVVAGGADNAAALAKLVLTTSDIDFSRWYGGPLDASLAVLPSPVGGLHPSTDDLVTRFADALREKLAAAEAKYGYRDNWRRADWMDECRAHLRDHLEKGDPRDVAAYCAFLWHHGEGTAIPTHRELAMPDGETRRITQVRERGTGRVIGEQG